MNSTSRDTPLAVLLAAADLALINIAFYFSYWLRYEREVFRAVPDGSQVSISEYAPIQIMLSVVLITAYFLAGLYRKPTRTGFVDDFASLLSATSIGMMLVLSVVLLFQGTAYSRLLFIMLWAMVIIFLGVWRLVKRRVVVYFHGRGVGVQRAIVIGNNPLGLMVMHLMVSDPGLGYRLLGFVSDEGVDNVGRFTCLGSIADVGKIVNDHLVDEVVIALPTSAHHQAIKIAEQAHRQNISFKIVPDLYELSLRQVNIDDLRGIPLIGLKDPTITGADRFIKRGLDLAIALAALAALSPLWLVISLAIKLESKGPILFRQLRVGRGGVHFNVWKFRSMSEHAEVVKDELNDLNDASGPIFKIKNDPRRTKVGALLRRLSLDELPQLLNVIMGEMSIVGPRPLVPSEAEGAGEWQSKRLQVQPGMTGLWQVSGRSDLPFDEMVLLDIYYIENWSIGLDLKIIMRTIPAVITAKGAY